MIDKGKNRTSWPGLPRPSGSGKAKNTVFWSGCLYPLLGFLLIYAFYVLLFIRLLPDPAVPFFISLFTAIGTGALLTGLLDLLRVRKLGAAIRREQEGTARRDGRFEAFSGTIHPLQEALVSPFQGRPCVAYEYDLAAASKNNETIGSKAWGWALTPAVIRAAAGDQRLLGFPELERFDQNVVGAGARERIQTYFKDTLFETLEFGDIKKSLDQIVERSTDDDGQARADLLRGADLNSQDFDKFQCTERVVPVGEEVTAFGIYSSARGGLVPHPKKATGMVQLWPGKGDGLKTVIEKEAWGRLTIGIVVFFLTHAFMSTIFFVMWLKGYYG
jgi:hypothetical protein